MSTVTPQNWTFSLGNVKLTRFEVPSDFVDGVESHVAVHRYINESGAAATQVHVLGNYPLPTDWSGKLFGNTALSRHAQLKALIGQQVTFTYGPLSWLVFVARYTGSIHHQQEVYYKIELIVIAERNGILPQPESGTSFDAGTQAFYDQGNQGHQDLVAADPQLPASVTTTYVAANTLIQNSYPLKLQPFTTILAIVTAITAYTQALSDYAAPLENNAVLEADLAKLDACLRALQGFGLLTFNLNQILGLAPQSQIISIITGDLFSIAAQYYPNQDPATIAGLLATANGLNDFFISFPTQLVLPPVFS